jgi:hypothetical protein
MAEHYTFDYEETDDPYYQIYPVTVAGEMALLDNSLGIVAEETPENTTRIRQLVDILDALAESNA